MLDLERAVLAPAVSGRLGQMACVSLTLHPAPGLAHAFAGRVQLTGEPSWPKAALAVLLSCRGAGHPQGASPTQTSLLMASLLVKSDSGL